MAGKKDDIVSNVVKSLNKKSGEDGEVLAFTLGDMFAPEYKGFVPTGNLAVDYVIGKPGFPIGRMIELAGPYGSGKSSIIARAIGAAQKVGVTVALIDSEFSYSPDWAMLHGVNPEKLILIHPTHLQGVFDTIISIINEAKKIDPDKPMFIVVDSLSIASAEELEEEDSTAGKQRGQHAAIISRGIRKITGRLWKHNVAVVFVSQLKDNPGMMYGANKSKLGGHAIEFHGGILLEVKRKTYIKSDTEDKTIGMTVGVEAIKNKFVPPFRARTFDLFFEEGIRPKEILLDFLSDPLNQIKKSGGWYDWNGSKYRKSDLAEKLDEAREKEVYELLGLSEKENKKK